MKRILSLALVLCTLLSCAVLFSSCGSKEGDDWPVTVNGVTIKEEPKKIVVLNDTLADIISYIGYDIKMVGKSEECDQEFLSVVPAMGTAAAPDVNAIKNEGADLVIADSTLSQDAKSNIESGGAQVITFDIPTTEEALKDLYINLGTALGGKETGAEKGEKGHDDLFDMLQTLNTATTDIVQPVAYLYLDQNGQLCTFTKGSLEYKFFNYNGNSNVFANQEKPEINPQELRLGSPKYIFYDSEDVLTALAANDEFRNVNALKNGKTCQIAKKDFMRFGTSAEQAVYMMLSYIEKDSKATKDEATPGDAAVPAVPTAAAQEAPAETAAATTAAQADSADAGSDDVIEYSFEE